jgi:hypothetical protein
MNDIRSINIQHVIGNEHPQYGGADKTQTRAEPKVCGVPVELNPLDHAKNLAVAQF